MSLRYIAGLLGVAPTVVAPVDGEGGSAPGIWTRPDQANLQALGRGQNLLWTNIYGVGVTTPLDS
jgi:hypothetical protein